jgi:hypothetical protein
LAGTPSASLEGTDVILTDVLSFAVIPIISINGVPTPSPDIAGNSYFKNYPNVRLFDTWSNRADGTYEYTFWDQSVPNMSVLTGLQISIRVWDEKTKQARQITVIQDL